MPKDTQHAPLDVVNTFGKRLRETRERLGLTQDQLVDEMQEKYQTKIGRTYISEIERTAKKGLAKKTPTVEIAEAMARVCNVSLDYLAGLTDNPKPPDDAEAEPHQWTPEADTVARIIDSLSAEKRIEILNVVRQMSDAAGISRRRRQRDIREILESVEYVSGPAARREVERRLRSTGSIFPMNDEDEQS